MDERQRFLGCRANDRNDGSGDLEDLDDSADRYCLLRFLLALDSLDHLSSSVLSPNLAMHCCVCRTRDTDHRWQKDVSSFWKTKDCTILDSLMSEPVDLFTHDKAGGDSHEEVIESPLVFKIQLLP